MTGGHVLALVVALATLLQPTTTQAASEKDLKGLSQALGKGVQCFLLPSEEYAPGTIFRVDKKKVSYIVSSEVAKKVDVKKRAAALGTINGTQQFTAGLVASLFNLKSGDQNLASAHGSFNRKRTVEARLDGLVYETTDDVEIEKVLGWFSAFQGKKAKNTYYVVREGYVADGISIKLGKNLVADFGGEGTVKDAVKLTPTIKYERTSDYELTRPLQPPLRTCVKSEEIELAGSGAVGPMYTLKKDTKMPQISRHGGTDP
jgi:hypothetical protein